MVDWGKDISMLSLTISKMSKKFAFNWTLGRRPKDLNVATGQREFRSGGIFPLSPEATDCGHHPTSDCQSRQALLLRGILDALLCPQCILGPPNRSGWNQFYFSHSVRMSFGVRPKV